MKVTFENPDKVSGLLTIVVEKEDYKANLDKELRTYRKKANLPGFRPGMVPMGIIKRQYGAMAKYDVVNKIVGDELYKYLEENKIDMLGSPMASDGQTPVDIDGPAPYTFAFDIAVAPEFDITLGGDDTIVRYMIKVEAKDIDEEIDIYRSRGGHHEKVEEYADSDMLKGTLTELDEAGKPKEGGITAKDAIVMPAYISAEEQKKLFDGARLGSVVTFNPRKAYPKSDYELASLLGVKKEDAAGVTSDFTYEITEISRYVKAAVDQDLFDSIYGKGVVTSEEQFRVKIAEAVKARYADESDYKFQQDLRKYCMEKVGKLTFPDELLKKMLKSKNKDKEPDYVDKYYDGSIKELEWQLIRNKLAKGFGVKVGDSDVREISEKMARAQFAGYGMFNAPEETVKAYAASMVKEEETLNKVIERCIDEKIMESVMKTVKLDEKEVTRDEFNELIRQSAGNA